MIKKNEKNYFAHETAVIDEGCEIGGGVKIWHFSHIMPGSKIGDNCNIGQNVVSPGVVLGKNVKVQNNVSIYTGVICEDDVFLGPSMVFTNVINPRSAIDRKNEYLKTRVRRGASIGANVTIVCGNDIGGVLNSKSKIIFVPPLSADIAIRIPSVNKVEEILGFKAKVDLEEGIAKTAEYFAKHQKAGV